MFCKLFSIVEIEVDQHAEIAEGMQNPTRIDVAEETDTFSAKTSFKAYGMDITAHDISSLAPCEMINDTMVTVLLRFVIRVVLIYCMK